MSPIWSKHFLDFMNESLRIFPWKRAKNAWCDSSLEVLSLRTLFVQHCPSQNSTNLDSRWKLHCVSPHWITTTQTCMITFAVFPWQIMSSAYFCGPGTRKSFACSISGCLATYGVRHEFFFCPDLMCSVDLNMVNLYKNLYFWEKTHQKTKSFVFFALKLLCKKPDPSTT